jgi:DNA-binding MarR family transcriptional regulator
METRNEPLEVPASALRELILAGENYRTRVARTMGIGVTESQALSYLLARGPMGQTSLANALGLTTGSTTSLIDRLEAAGLVRRSPDTDDRRRTTVHLSDTADARLVSAQRWIAQAFDAIPPGEIDQLSHHLHTLAGALREVTTSPGTIETDPAAGAEGTTEA